MDFFFLWVILGALFIIAIDKLLEYITKLWK